MLAYDILCYSEIKFVSINLGTFQLELAILLISRDIKHITDVNIYWNYMDI